MKKQVLLVAAAIGLTFATSAQDLKSKSGHTILPESGDWALGFDASPLINYAGNLFNGTSGNSMGAMWENGNNAIMGKYFLDANTAVRAWVRLGFGSTTNTEYVVDVTSTATPPAMVEDVEKVGYSAIVIGGGYEIRKGHNRLQGYYGGDLLISSVGSSSTYTYGNTLTTTNTSHNNTFGQGAGLMENKAGSTFGLGLRGFIGVEYFFAPKVSISAEYGWGLGFASTGDGETTVESWNGTAAETTTTTTAGGSTFGIDTDNNGGAIRLLFHF